MRTLHGWYGEMDFPAMTRTVERLCEAELAAGQQFGFSLPHEALFSEHALHADQARAIYEAAPPDAQRALRAAGLSEFADALATGNYDHLIF